MLLASVQLGFSIEQRPDGFHVFPGDQIQDALEIAAKNPTNKVVKVHAGEYRPKAKRPALIWFNAIHDGLVVEAVGEVTLTAANADLTRKGVSSFPAVVNHVVYFGHGITTNTVFRGFRLTGARGFATEKFMKTVEPDETVPRNSFLVTDGGAIKVFGRSRPILENLEIVDNFATPCGGGVSVQQQGLDSEPIVFRNCIFRNNRAQVTGAALDLLEGSSALLTNCLFTGNIANTGIDIVAKHSGEMPFTNSGALTIFRNSRAIVQGCTFTGNRNGVDDMGGASVYQDCIFYGNTADGSSFQGSRYDLDIPKGAMVKNCFFSSPVVDPLGSISRDTNVLNAPAPEFNSGFEALSKAYKGAGYRISPAR